VGRQPASDTRDRILSTALELFNARGYRGTSMQKIADRLGLTKAALYYHFATKDDILNELLSPPLDRLDAAIATRRSTRPRAKRTSRRSAAASSRNAWTR